MSSLLGDDMTTLDDLDSLLGTDNEMANMDGFEQPTAASAAAPPPMPKKEVQVGEFDCSQCHETLLNVPRWITVFGKRYHIEHFQCTTCSKPIGENFYERDGQAFCAEDYQAQYGPTCRHCNNLNLYSHFAFSDAGRALGGTWVYALGSQWHTRCFGCATCRRPLDGEGYFQANGKAFCQTHYHQQASSVCGNCGKAVEGNAFVTIGSSRWHTACSRCSFCEVAITDGGAKEKAKKWYCNHCHRSLFE